MTDVPLLCHVREMDDEPHAMHYANKPQGFVTARRRQIPVYNSK